MEGPVLTSDICVFLTFYFIACKANELVTCSSSRACLSLRERLAITTDRLKQCKQMARAYALKRKMTITKC